MTALGVLNPNGDYTIDMLDAILQDWGNSVGHLNLQVVAVRSNQQFLTFGGHINNRRLIFISNDDGQDESRGIHGHWEGLHRRTQG